MLTKILPLLTSLLLLLSTQLLAKPSPYQYHFSTIEKLVKQDVGSFVLTEIYNSVGLNVKISSFPAKRAEMMGTSGVLDGEVMRIWAFGELHPEVLRVPTPVYQLELMPYVLAHKNIVITKSEDLNAYKVAAVTGVKHSQKVKMLYYSQNPENMFKLLKNGQIDVALINRLDGEATLKRLGYSDITSMEKPVERYDLFHYLHAQHQNLVPTINEAILKLKASGQLQNLIVAAEQKVMNAQ